MTINYLVFTFFGSKFIVGHFVQGECLLETQAHVVDRFVTGMMGKNTKKQPAPQTESGDEEETENEQQTEGNMQLFNVDLVIK